MELAKDGYLLECAGCAGLGTSETRLPDKALLQAKLDEFYELAKLESGQ